MLREEVIEAIANYYRITTDTDDYDWNSGCTVRGDDGEYRWMTFNNVLEAIEEAGVLEDEDE